MKRFIYFMPSRPFLVTVKAAYTRWTSLHREPHPTDAWYHPTASCRNLPSPQRNLPTSRWTHHFFPLQWGTLASWFLYRVDLSGRGYLKSLRGKLHAPWHFGYALVYPFQLLLQVPAQRGRALRDTSLGLVHTKLSQWQGLLRFLLKVFWSVVRTGLFSGYRVSLNT